mgnify:CR=1 FL=1
MEAVANPVVHVLLLPPLLGSDRGALRRCCSHSLKQRAPVFELKGRQNSGRGAYGKEGPPNRGNVTIIVTVACVALGAPYRHTANWRCIAVPVTLIKGGERPHPATVTPSPPRSTPPAPHPTRSPQTARALHRREPIAVATLSVAARRDQQPHHLPDPPQPPAAHGDPVQRRSAGCREAARVRTQPQHLRHTLGVLRHRRLHQRRDAARVQYVDVRAARHPRPHGVDVRALA